MLALTLKNKGKGGTLPLTSLIRRLGVISLLKAKYTNLVS